MASKPLASTARAPLARIWASAASRTTGALEMTATVRPDRGFTGARRSSATAKSASNQNSAPQ